MINGETTYIYLLSDPMSQFTMLDLQVLNNVKLVNKHKLFKNKVLNILSKSHLSLKANEFISLPLKKIWYKKLLRYKSDKKVVVIMSPPWYDRQLIKFLRKNYSNCKLILHFHDIVAKDLKYNKQLKIERIKKDFDQIIVYNQVDAEAYGFVYHPVGYAPPSKKELKNTLIVI